MISVSTPRNGLDLDSDLSNIPDGSYVNANNVKIKSDGSTNGFLLTNTEGNEFAFSLGEIQPKNRKWYIQDGTPSVTYSLELQDNQGNILVSTLFELTFSSLLTQFAADCAAVSISLNIVKNATEATIEITEWPYYDYVLTTYQPENFAYFYLVSESIDDAEAYLGNKRVLSSHEGTDGAYIYSTNQAHQKSQDWTENVLLAETQDNGSGILQIINATLPQGLIVGNYYKINITGSTSYNGAHIAKITFANTIDIIDVPFGAQERLVTQWYFSNYGEIGFVDYATTSYTKIWSTTQWDFSIFNPVDSRVEPSAIGYDQLYFCSLQDINRVFYLQTGTPVYNTTLFGLTLVPPYHVLYGGQYTYESILEQTALTPTNKSITTFTSQSQSGGGILAGDWRYATSLLTVSGAETALTDLTQPINVFSSDISANYNSVLGDEGTVITGKINNLNVTGITAGVYRYAVLYGFHYTGGAVAAYRIKQQILNNSDVEAIISHEGTETYEVVSFAELKFNTLQYYSKNIELIDNYLTFSNLRKKGNPDLTDFAKSATHNIQQELVETGEYKNPQNVNGSVGCMVNEDYVWAAQFELMDGSFTDQVYYIDTIRINFYESGGIPVNQGNPTDNRRVSGGISDMSITDSSGNPYLFYPKIIFDWSTLIGAHPAYTVIKSVKFFRAEVINPRVIACGFVVPTVYTASSTTNILRFSGDGGSFNANQIFAMPFAFGNPYLGTNAVFPAPHYASDFIGSTTNTQHFAFYSPDYFYTGNHFTNLSGDTFILENTITASSPTFVNSPAKPVSSSYKSFIGYPNAEIEKDVNSVSYCPSGSQVTIGAKIFNNLLYNGIDDNPNHWNAFSCHVIELRTTTDIAPSYAAYGYYIRPRTNQYGDLTLLKYAYTGVSEISLIGTTETLINNGGDTFTQQSAFKQRVKIADTIGDWANSGTSYYTQNRINSQMRVRVGTQFTFQTTTIANWLCNIEQEAFNYNTGYSIYGNDYIKTLTPFDPNLNTITEYSSRAIWTNPKPAGSLVDDYRTLPPFNFYDFPIVNGGITAHINVNRRLMFLQPKKFTLKYFNSEGQFTTQSLDTVILGENAVMSRREQEISNFGCSHKQSVAKGLSEGGSENLYWVCSQYKKIMRFGADGTVSLSDRARIKSWCEANILSAFNDITESTTGRGISGVWNQKDKEYYATFRYGSSGTTLTLTKTIVFNEVTNRFVSFMDFFPTIYIPFQTYFITPNSLTYLWYPNNTSNVSTDTGYCYIHNDDIVDNSVYPTYYVSVFPDTNVTLVTNADVINNKIFQNFSIDYEGSFADVTFATKTQTAGVGDNEYAMDLYRGQVGLDVNDNPLNGVWIKTFLTFASDEIVKLKRYTVKFIQSFRITQI